MNRFLIPFLILLGSFLFSWYWNAVKRPLCDGQVAGVSQTTDCCGNAIAPIAAVVDTTALVDTTTKVMTAEEQVLFKPLDVYFETAKANFNRTAEVDSFLTTAKRYLAKNPEEKLSVIGHTDSDGSDATNNPLSVRRANMVKGILVKEGFNAANLVASGKGETEPIVDNNTPENRAKNRRVSIRLIK